MRKLTTLSYQRELFKLKWRALFSKQKPSIRGGVSSTKERMKPVNVCNFT